ncbi:MAG TPA: Smr/MutS family protein [Caulobacteraceae bacterium]|nr:Smr/MutS family protein [Caulobacteraceae bacterium]
MKRDLDHEDLRLWAIVAATVRPAHGRTVPVIAGAAKAAALPRPTTPPADRSSAPRRHVPSPPDAIEPKRRHRIVHDREALAARIDLHGMTHDQARASLTAFMARAYDQGWRAVLVITGKGALGDGVLRRQAPEWLAQAPIRPMVAGVSEAHRRHGGEGALYVALKRKPRA